MLCEECNHNQATVVITVTAGDEITTRHLCPECMKKMENSFAQGDVQSFLSSLLALLSVEPKATKLTCSACGLTYVQFQHTGKLGCAHCYESFAQELQPLLTRIHGRSQHAGHVPPGHEAPSQAQEAEAAPETVAPAKDLSPSSDSIAHLRQKMEDAVVQEDFEEAARLRDQIRFLGQQSERSVQHE